MLGGVICIAQKTWAPLPPLSGAVYARPTVFYLVK